VIEQAERDTGTGRVSEVVHIQTPMWLKPAFWLAVVFLAATLFLFAIGQWQNGRGVRSAAEESKAKAQELKVQVDKLTGQIECRSQRTNDLNAITGDSIGELLKMVNGLSDHQPPEFYAPIKARLKDLDAERDTAKQQAVTAVQDCQGR
jgi:hypothetical protein